MKTGRMFLFGVAALLIVVGCGGTSAEKSATLTFEMVVLQIDDEQLINGNVYNDLDGDGQLDPGEPGIPGVTVTLDDVETATTDADGYYAFAVSPFMDYTVTETVPDGFQLTSPNPRYVTTADVDEMVNFFNHAQSGDFPIDVKPGSDINPLNLKSNGVLPVAICGSETFDVSQIDPSSLLLNGVAPLRWSYEDVCGHDDMGMDPDMNGDDGEMPDGYEDMTLKFSTQEIAATLGDVMRGDIVTLTMTGALLGSDPISGEETVWIVQVPKK